MLENIDCGLSGFRHEIVIERVCPEKHFRAASGSRPAFPKPCLERLYGECWNLPLSRHSSGHFRETAQNRKLSKQVHKPGSDRRQLRPFVDPSKCVRVYGTNAPIPIVSKKLSLVGRHVNVHRAITFASLEGQAQIQRLFYVLIMPSIVYDVAVHHLPEQMCSPARGVHLFPRDHVARTHCVLLTFAIFPAALAYPNAPQCCVSEAAVIFWKLEVGGRIPRFVIRTQTQVFVDAIWIHDFPWI